jgi:hypothetical protein
MDDINEKYFFFNYTLDIESVYYYLDKVYIRHKPFAIYPILYNHI